MLELKNIYKTFNPGSINEKRALNGINLTLEDGDFVTIIGGNGAGKSTMLNAIAGVWPVDSGSVIIDGEDINIYMMNPKSPCFIKDEEESYIYLILPVNFNAATV